MHLLVYGYVRTESVFEVPQVLAKLCSSYFGDAFHWNFYGKELENFLSSINGEVLYSQPFKINNIIFQMQLRPNEYDEIQTGFVGFKLLLKRVTAQPIFASNSSDDEDDDDPDNDIFMTSNKRINRMNRATNKHNRNRMYNGDIVIDYELYCHQRNSTEISMKHQEKVTYKRKNFHTSTYHNIQNQRAAIEFKNKNGPGPHPIAINRFDLFGPSAVEIGEYSFYDVSILDERLRTDPSLCFGLNIVIEKANKKKNKKRKKKKKKGKDKDKEKDEDEDEDKEKKTSKRRSSRIKIKKEKDDNNDNNMFCIPCPDKKSKSKGKSKGSKAKSKSKKENLMINGIDGVNNIYGMN